MSPAASDGEFNAEDPGPEHFTSGSNELVVAVAHLRLVRNSLAELGIPVLDEKISAPLGLALVAVSDRQHLTGEVRARLQAGDRQPRGKPEDYLGQVLAAVKKTFGKGKDAWEPTIGRNRLVGHVAATDGRVIVAYGEPELVTDASQKFAPRPDAQQITGWARRARVGVADTPLRPHSWLEGAWLAPYPTSLPDGVPGAPNYRAGHATAVAGLVLDRAPDADVQVRAILDDDGAATSWDVGTGLIQFAGTGIDVLNLSFACYTMDGRPPLCLSAAIDRLQSSTLVVAAAGNYGKVGVVTTDAGDIDLSTAPAWPAALPGVVAVGSCAEGGRPSDFSPDASWVNVLSTGEGVVSLMVRGLLEGATTADEFARWTGTSFSAARVAGAIAARVRPGSVSATDVWNSMLAASESSTAPFVVG